MGNLRMGNLPILPQSERRHNRRNLRGDGQQHQHGKGNAKAQFERVVALAILRNVMNWVYHPILIQQPVAKIVALAPRHGRQPVSKPETRACPLSLSRPMR
jgi:hypothetical protein